MAEIIKATVCNVPSQTVSLVAYGDKFIERIARMAHEVNRAYCEEIGDSTQKPWDEAPEWQKASAIDGVKFLLYHPEANHMDGHVNWMNRKFKDGWSFGPVKDEAKKQHPSLVMFSFLPTEQKVKDRLFHAVVRSSVAK